MAASIKILKTKQQTYSDWEILKMEFVFQCIQAKSLTLSMLFFKYLARNLQHSSLNGCFNEDSENKIANVFSLIFAAFSCSYGDISVTIAR